MTTRTWLQVAAMMLAALASDAGSAWQMDPRAMAGMDMPPVAASAPRPPSPSMPMDAMPGMATPTAAISAIASNDHVAPRAPTHPMAPMSPATMAGAMQMDDQATRGMLRVDRLERTISARGDASTRWETDAWWGDDIDRLWLRGEGEQDQGERRDARAELLWSHAFSTFWDGRLGVRDDAGGGPTRQWVALGVRGLAPYWFDLDAMFYAGTQGRTAARVEASYDLRFTQRLILTPDLELNFYGRNDPRRDVHAGLSDAEFGLRLRHEFSRRLAPYLGVNWTWRGGGTARESMLRRQPVHELQWLLGVRFWL